MKDLDAMLTIAQEAVEIGRKLMTTESLPIEELAALITGTLIQIFHVHNTNFHYPLRRFIGRV